MLTKSPGPLVARPVFITMLALTLVACSDAAKPNDVGPFAVHSTTPQAITSSSRSDARQRLRAANRYSWVGEAHNKAIDEFRARVRRPGFLSKNVCAYVEAFVAEPGRIPTERRIESRGAPYKAARDARVEASLCQSPGSLRRGARTGHASTGTGRQSTELSQMLAAAESAVDGASGPEDLAAGLLPILGATASLPEAERVVMEVTLSVAQSSYEYWYAELSSFSQEITTEYDACGSAGPDPIDGCGGGGLDWGVVSYGRLAPRSAGTLAEPGCPEPSLGEGMKSIGKSDLKGAFMGAFGGMFAGGLGGAVAGGLTGAMAGSIYAGLENVFLAFYCHYKK